MKEIRKTFTDGRGNTLDMTVDERGAWEATLTGPEYGPGAWFGGSNVDQGGDLRDEVWTFPGVQEWLDSAEVTALLEG